MRIATHCGSGRKQHRVGPVDDQAIVAQAAGDRADNQTSTDVNGPQRERHHRSRMGLSMLDIHSSVWFEGLSTLGDHGLALCLFLVDAGQDHPKYRLRNPGGSMREMIRRANAGTLNMSASLATLRKRRGGAVSRGSYLERGLAKIGLELC